MRTKSKKPGKQRKYEAEISKNEAHKLLSAPLSKKLREEKGFRSLPVRSGDEVLVVRGDFKGESGKVSKTSPREARIYIDGIGSKTTEGQEIALPVHPSNVVIQKYHTRDEKRLELINRRIEDSEKKIDIEFVLAEAEAEEEEDLIEFDDDEFDEIDEDALLIDDELDELEDEELDEEFELIEEEEEEEDFDLIEEDDEDEEEETQ